ncbi:DUF4331 domain-containing protein [Kitasatospora sp. NPDC002040]|uniref:DUF4331 domain-containing protein n=1 Tax=Kitasatospora sp. NPDC002040 TaxID=3154661 RepID=UPI003334A2B4
MAGLGVLALAAAGALAGLAPSTGYASSHREAPLIAGDPRADNTDVYAFVSPDNPDTVTLVANWIPMEEPNGGPNFYPFADDARYNIKIDSDGDGKPDTTYTWTFAGHYRDDANQFLYNTGVVKSLDDETLNYRQTYTLTATCPDGSTKTLVKDAPVAPSNVGKASMPDYGALRKQAVVGLPGGGQSFAGQADDPFFLDLRVFDLLYGGNLKESGHDTLTGYNVNTIALQVPKKDLALKGDAERNPVIGVWSTTERQGAVVADKGGEGKGEAGWRQVSRLGNPLVNEVVVPLKYKDAFNALTPDKDRTVTPVVDKVKDPIVPKLIQSIYGIPAPAAPRNDLVEIFLTGVCKACGPVQADLNSQLLNKDVPKDVFVPSEELRLNMAVPPAAAPNRLGVLAGDVAGFPNGRRLADDVVDITLQAAEGAAQSGQLVAALAAGDGVNANDHAFGHHFPYVALPNTAAVNEAEQGSLSGSVEAGFGGLAGDGFSVTGATALAGGALLSAAGVIALRRRRAARS